MPRALPDWLDAYMAYMDNSEPADSFKMWTALSCIAACLKRKCFLEWGTLTFYPNLYVVLVGPSGCRKGTAMGPGFDMLQTIGVRMAAEATTREALIRELRKSSDNSVNVQTGEMQMHSSLTIYSQELTVFLGYNNLQLLSDLTDWYDCRTRWTYRTKNMGEDEIIGVWVNLFGATTPSLLQTTLPSDAIGGGLTSRMIFVYEAGKGKTVPIPFLSEEQEALKPRLLHDLEVIHMLQGQFKYSQDFVDTYMAWYVAQESNPPFKDERLAGYVERRANHVLKLSMVLSASRSDELYVTKFDIDRAIKILTLTEANMLRAFSGVGKSAYASVTARINALIETEGLVDKADIYTRFLHDADTRALENILTSIITAGNAVCEHKGTKIFFRRKD